MIQNLNTFGGLLVRLIKNAEFSIVFKFEHELVGVLVDITEMVYHCLLVHLLRDTVEVALIENLLGNDLMLVVQDRHSHAVNFTSVLADKKAQLLNKTLFLQAHLNRYESVNSCVVELTS